MASASLLVLPSAEWLASWRALLDLFLSVWAGTFAAALVVSWVTLAAVAGFRPDTSARPSTAGEPAKSAGRCHPSPLWAATLLAICTLELLTHAGERNGFLATSRPTAGVETWTVADGYAVLLDGIPAQGDGLHLLGLLGLFLGDRPPSPSEFDRRAGHVFLVSLLTRPLGVYWSFAAVNLLSWWAAALAVWWLGQRRWPGTAVPWIASLLTATGHGFIFMGAAPQAHAPAFAAFALTIALCDALHIWSAKARLLDWAKTGWAIGAAGLIYLVHIPALLFLWLYGIGRTRLRDLALATAVALSITTAWELYGSLLLGLRFDGGNNDLAGVALAGWLRLAQAGPAYMLGQLHASSIRGLLGAAFYYPWWPLAAVGLVASSPPNRRWALAIMLAVLIPAIAFSTRFNLPRVGYLMYPAVYLLAARGIEVIGAICARPWRQPTGARSIETSVTTSGSPTVAHVSGTAASSAVALPSQSSLLRWRLDTAQVAVIVAVVVFLVLLANLDLVGMQQFNLWFHYSQGNAW
ncbi:MAG: hypothetical protein HY332_21070 [Chloroflexi bacterium]|nr:hypothetical protein [Chloroflexota bacterium]